MPVADFAGGRNWGYDGVALFAPSRAYGTPDDLRRLVDAAHAHGLAVILDVVYNHLGPEGAYLAAVQPCTTSPTGTARRGARRSTSTPGSRSSGGSSSTTPLHWVREYHVDGLRLDATHALIDDSPKHIVQEIAETVTRRRLAGRSSFTPKTTGTSPRWSKTPRSAAGGSTASGPTTSTTSSGAWWPATTHGYYADFAGHTRELATIIRGGLAVLRRSIRCT